MAQNKNSNGAHRLSRPISSGDRQRTGLERHGTVTSSAKSQVERGSPLRARRAAASQANRSAAGGMLKSSRKIAVLSA
jgi:hypothetical protein